MAGALYLLAPWPSEIRQRAREHRLEHESDEVYFPNVIRLMSLQENLGDPIAVTSIEAARTCYMQMDNLLTKGAWTSGRHGVLAEGSQPAGSAIRARNNRAQVTHPESAPRLGRVHASAPLAR
jgi:hypothetical protein